MKYGLSAYNLNLYKDIIGDEMTGESWMNFGQDDPEGELASHFLPTIVVSMHVAVVIRI